MARLRDRTRQIPNGLKYFQAETGFDATKTTGSHPSFDRLVDTVLAHRIGNPRFKSKWRTDRAGVEIDVEAFNVALCIAHGWTEYLSDGQFQFIPAMPLLFWPKQFLKPFEVVK